jgi:hypothetical protein
MKIRKIEQQTGKTNRFTVFHLKFESLGFQFFHQNLKIEFCTENRPVFLGFAIFGKTGEGQFWKRYCNPWQLQMPI